jgi:PII-like signaling protein
MYEAILLFLRENRFPGATVVREEKIQELLPDFDAPIGGGLITLERARVVVYRPAEKTEHS